MSHVFPGVMQVCYVGIFCPGIDRNMPTIRDHDNHLYIRHWSGGIMAGCFETNGRAVFEDGVPKSFEFQLLPEDWDHCRKSTCTQSYTIIFSADCLGLRVSPFQILKKSPVKILEYTLYIPKSSICIWSNTR